MRKPRYRVIDEQVSKLLDSNGITEPPVNVEMLAKKLGIFVRRISAESELSGFIARQGGGTVIGVNADHHLNRQRFTISHELGHFFLHDFAEVHVDRVNTDRYLVRLRDENSGTGDDTDEIEANRFAAALLMPAEFLRLELEELGASNFLDERGMQQLAKRFQVSVQALINRLTSLNFIESIRLD